MTLNPNLYPAILANLTAGKPAFADLAALLDTIPEIKGEIITQMLQMRGADLAALCSQDIPAHITLHVAAEALLPQPPIDWIIEPLLSAGTLSLVVGEPGSKKTYSMLSLAVCVGLGLDWLDLKTAQNPVLIIDEESGARRMARRLGDVMRGYQADDTTPVYYVTLAGFDFRQPDDLNTLDGLMRQTGARLVVIDALADVIPGADENAVKDVQPVFMGLRRVAETFQAAIILIHHTNRKGTYRGSSALKGAVDVLLKAESEPKSVDIDFKIEKNRDGEPFAFSAVATFDTVFQRFFLTPSTYQAKAPAFSKAQTYVIRYLGINGAAMVTDIKSRADTCSENAARGAVYTLTNSGYLQRVDDGKPGEAATYDLTDKGKKYYELNL